MTVSQTAVVAADKVVSIHYTLTSGRGELLDSSRDRAPLPYLHGHGNIVPGLERALEGRATGSRFDVTVEPADAYGLRSDVPPQPVPRRHLPDDVQILPGMQFLAETSDGGIQPLWVDRIGGDLVFLDPNHPLAGETLHFSVEVVAVRDATAHELEHGHPHGLDGTAAH